MIRVIVCGQPAKNQFYKVPWRTLQLPANWCCSHLQSSLLVYLMHLGVVLMDVVEHYQYFEASERLVTNQLQQLKHYFSHFC